MKYLIENIGTLVTLEKASQKKGRKIISKDLSLLHNTSLLIEGGMIKEISSKKTNRAAKKINAKGNALLPGFVDAHTHLVFAGNRAFEFEFRSQGKTYEEIHARGGGILSTVEKTRKASQEELFEKAFHYLKKVKESGTTTIEIKSGYGLSPRDEIKILKVIQKLQKEKILTIIPTFLGAHTIPKEYKNNPNFYVELLCKGMIPQVSEEKLAEFCDIFIEKGSFTLKQAEKILETASKYKLKIKVHTEQFNNIGGSALALNYKATSIDHLEKISEKNIKKISQSQTTATLLPGVSFFLGLNQAPARKLLDSGARVAIASDFNPGSSMSFSMPLMGTIAMTQMKMTLSEALVASTLNGAYSLGIEKQTGSLEVGKRADLILLNEPEYRIPFYHFGLNHIQKTYSYLDFP
ncbi:MAG: imidazolonepropionase [Deltaproteobacteria bacterium]|nr:imidazolonepropionase [Deltaproteobacteria bacterium]